MTKTLEERAADLLPRLAGNYSISVNDGAGLLNGEDKFKRSFPVPPINNEATQLITDQQARIRELEAVKVKVNLWNSASEVTEEEGEKAIVAVLKKLHEHVGTDERGIMSHDFDEEYTAHEIAKAALEAARKVRITKE